MGVSRQNLSDSEAFYGYLCPEERGEFGLGNENHDAGETDDLRFEGSEPL